MEKMQLNQKTYFSISALITFFVLRHLRDFQSKKKNMLREEEKRKKNIDKIFIRMCVKEWGKKWVWE